jgi:hypothetical protein
MDFSLTSHQLLTVAQAIGDGRWIRHLKRNLSAQATREFTALWTAINNTVLREESDRVSWKWTANGEFSSKSAYLIQFQGCISAGFSNFIWKSDAPGKCKIFAWLAMLGRCNTADVLAKKGWPHDASCALCNGPMEDVIHLLATCPFSIQIWHAVLRYCNLRLDLAPSPTTTSLAQWVEQTTNMITGAERKNWSSLVQLIWWTTWNERNARIFRNQSSNVSAVLDRMIEEARTWHTAGRRRASILMFRPREPD